MTASDDTQRCPRCSSSRIRRIQELFGAGWRDYCDDCENIFSRPTQIWPSADIAVEPRLNSVLAEFIEDPYASGRFENLGCQGLPVDVYNELLRVAADKHVSIYYLAAIYKCGHADALSRLRPIRARSAANISKDGDDPPNWPEECGCPRCQEARYEEARNDEV